MKWHLPGFVSNDFIEPSACDVTLSDSSVWKLLTIMVMQSEPCDARRLERQQAKGELQTTEAIFKLHDQTFCASKNV